MYNYNPYFGQQRMQYQPPMYAPQEPTMPIYRQNQQTAQFIPLQGKTVDNIEVVKAMDIPLDGSVSYFPIADGSAIVSKQLQSDGASKTIVYMPVSDENMPKIEKYITVDKFNEEMAKIENSGVSDEIKGIKRQIKNLSEDLEEIKNRKGN